MHGEAVRYAAEVGTADVRAALGWLDRAGFVVAESSGGRDEPFGNVYLLFAGAAQVRVVRDRSQWAVDVGLLPGGQLYSLDILMAARDGGSWVYPTRSPGQLPTQLPPGVSWRDELPSVIEWFQQPGAVEKADLVDAQARLARRGRFRL